MAKPKELKELEKFVETATRQIDILTTVQIAIVEHLGKKSHKFRNEFMATVLSRDDFREEYTKFTQENKDVPDEVKLEMIRINELIEEAKKMMGDDNAELDK
tara:strand:+ start:3338 stop:3643 length:306 start_codon:yes stop_codon:yes gene_type:complete